MTLCPIRLDVEPLATSPPSISLALLKDHLAIDYPDLDALIKTNLAAAVGAFEGTTHRTVLRRVHRWVLADFPQTDYQRIRLPRGKTRAVQRIEVTIGGVVTTLHGPSSGSPAGTDYREDLTGDDGAEVMPSRSSSWPAPDYDSPAPVAIVFEAGWSPSEIPAGIMRALMFWVRAGIDDERGEISPANLAANRDAFEALVSGWRLTRWY
jgi:hypothetical protein